jgi:hypothetical protein
MRLRFQSAYRAVVEGMPYSADALISIDPALPELNQLCVELSQPTYTLTAAGKVIIDKVPDGAASPNLADACCICFSPFQSGAYFAATHRAVGVTAATPAATTMLPARLDGVFATLAFSDDSAALVYCGTNRPAVAPGLWLLDFDLVQLDAHADGWLRAAEEHLVDLRDTVGGGVVRVEGFFIDDYASGWASQLLRHDEFVFAVGDELPPPQERFNLARPYAASGLVTLGPGAQQREVTYKGTRRNFLRELLAAQQPRESSPLAQAFALAVLLKYWGSVSVPASAVGECPPAPAAPRVELG